MLAVRTARAGCKDIPSTRHRLANYNKATAPLLDYYRNTGKIRSVMASGEIDAIYAEIVKILR